MAANYIVVPNPSELLLLKYLLNIESPDDGVLHVFTNNVTLGPLTVAGDLIEPVDVSYAAIPLTHGSWTVSTVSGVAVAEYPQQTFTFAGAQTIWGYFVTNVGGDLLWVQKGDCISSIPAGGGTYLVTPRFKVSQQ